MTVDQTPLSLPSSLATSPWLQPAASCWPAPGNSSHWYPDRAETAAAAAASAGADGGERQPAPMLSPWPRIFPGL